jgi:hypothetical protein
LRDPLLVLGALACPIGMGAMMWAMGKGLFGGKSERPDDRRSVEDLRAEHDRLSAEIAALETDRESDGRVASPSRHADA